MTGRKDLTGGELSAVRLVPAGSVELLANDLGPWGKPATPAPQRLLRQPSDARLNVDDRQKTVSPLRRFGHRLPAYFRVPLTQATEEHAKGELTVWAARQECLPAIQAAKG